MLKDAFHKHNKETIATARAEADAFYVDCLATYASAGGYARSLEEYRREAALMPYHVYVEKDQVSELAQLLTAQNKMDPVQLERQVGRRIGSRSAEMTIGVLEGKSGLGQVGGFLSVDCDVWTDLVDMALKAITDPDRSAIEDRLKTYYVLPPMGLTTQITQARPRGVMYPKTRPLAPGT